jgi:hypothetical protein
MSERWEYVSRCNGTTLKVVVATREEATRLMGYACGGRCSRRHSIQPTTKPLGIRTLTDDS